MLTKDGLKKDFRKDWKKHYELETFRKEGFGRKECRKCGKGFWSSNPDRELCGDSTCENYSFLGKSVTKKKFDYVELWEKFAEYFKKNGHTEIGRYPVICRWREDLFFTNASIVDFQRWQNGKITFQYPENPLIVPQVCLRFNDIPNVGVSGRHLTSFIMGGQHAFNPPKEGYWKDECIDYNYGFLTEVMGISKEELTYVEDIWTMPDFSAFGPCMETFSRGLELVNSVFMQFTKRGNSPQELPMKVIDVGWGHGRITWLSRGTPTEYDAVFGSAIERMKKKSGIDYDGDFFLKYSSLAGSLDIDEAADVGNAREEIAKRLKVDTGKLLEKVEPMHALYAIADHLRTVSFAIADGGIPSNVGGGYNLRVILRRAMNFMEEQEFGFDMENVVEWHADYLRKLFPELKENLGTVGEILDIERGKYRKTSKRARRTVRTLLERTREFDEKTLIELYESKGVTPELIEDMAGKEGVQIPVDFYTTMTNKHMGEREEPQDSVDTADIPATEKLYYSYPDEKQFQGKVLQSFSLNGETWVALDRTLFYPTSGGQEHDTGTLDGAEVKDVRIFDGLILHKVSKPLKKGQTVLGKINWERREQLMQHHSATHIINGAARKVLGMHVWQHSAHKDVDKARLDITHYENLTDEQIREIEKIANEMVSKKVNLFRGSVPRKKAEISYGFRLYQGGAPPEKELRVISIPGFDDEACGGTHVANTGDIGYITILGMEKVQDGAVRITFAAGEAARKVLERRAKLLEEAAKELEVTEKEVPKAVEKLFGRWKKARKGMERLRKTRAEKVEYEFRKSRGIKVLVTEVPRADMKQLREISRRIGGNDAFLLLVGGNNKNYFVFSSAGERAVKKGFNAGKIVQGLCKSLGGGGGGPPEKGEGAAPRKTKLDLTKVEL